ncbi:MAG: hypothetical protein QOE63_5, partial [Acidimicrobiaceae bacterium]
AWIQLASERFTALGLAEAAARELAIGFVAGLQGAFRLSRAMHSTEPMEAVGAQQIAVLRAALDSVG